MELKLYLGAIVFFLNVQQYYSQKRSFDCDHPMIRLNDEVRVFNNIPGFTHKKMGVIYDVVYNRTLFLSVMIDKSSVSNSTVNATNMFGCSIDYSIPNSKPFPDNPGLLVPLRLGGSCDKFNTFPLNDACITSLEKLEEWTVNDVNQYGEVKYCIKLTYPDYEAEVEDVSEDLEQHNDEFRTPNRISALIYTSPANKNIRSMEMNNNANSLDCVVGATDN